MAATDTAMPANISCTIRNIRPAAGEAGPPIAVPGQRISTALSDVWTMSEGGMQRPPPEPTTQAVKHRGLAMMGNAAFQQDPGTIVRLPFDNPTLPLLAATLGDFHRQAISYCYWKSGKRIQSVLAGDGDLDLLVAREDQHRAQAILIEHGFKLFPSVALRDHPSILSYLGFDGPSGRLIHVHLHLRLIIGERLHKNYRLPGKPTSWRRPSLTRPWRSRYSIPRVKRCCWACAPASNCGGWIR